VFCWNRLGRCSLAEVGKIASRSCAAILGGGDKVFLKVRKLCYLWRAVDHKSEMLAPVGEIGVAELPNRQV
jgi:hypothetical protein